MHGEESVALRRVAVSRPHSDLDKIHEWAYGLRSVWRKFLLFWAGAAFALAVAFGAGILNLGPRIVWWIDAAGIFLLILSHIRYGKRRLRSGARE
jgi:hypothetical protein